MVVDEVVLSTDEEHLTANLAMLSCDDKDLVAELCDDDVDCVLAFDAVVDVVDVDAGAVVAAVVGVGVGVGSSSSITSIISWTD